MRLRIALLAGRPLRATMAVAALALVMIAGVHSPRAQPNPVPPSPAPEAPPDGSVGGVGDINIYPKRIVFHGRDRIATVALFNRSAGQGNYDIVLSDRMMTPAGNIVSLDSVEDVAQRAKVKSASTMLRWSPRKVTLLSKEAQTIRIMVRTPPDLPPGEYRAHFTAIQVPAEAVGGYSIDDAAGQGKKNGIGVRIVPRFGIAIPVIVRVGETTLQVGLRDVAVKALDQGRSGVAITISRSGTRSAYGDLMVTAPGSSKPIALIKGIGVYPEVDERPVVVPISPEVPASAYARGARLTVTYTDDDFRPGEVLARQEFVVP
jgi:hypothetical protein